MYVVAQYVPYEGTNEEGFETLEEAKAYLLRRKQAYPVSFNLMDVSVYRIAESYDPVALLKEAGYDFDQ